MASINSVLDQSLESRLEKFRKELRRSRATFSEKSIHDARVALRRLVSTLEVTKKTVPGARIKKLKRRLTKYLKSFSDLRDVQVQILTVKNLLLLYPESQPFYDFILKQEKRLIKTNRKMIDRINVGKIMRVVEDLRGVLVDRPGSDEADEERLAGIIAIVDKAFQKVVALKDLLDERHTATIHRMRVSFKKFRYKVEALKPLLTSVTDQHLLDMNSYQVMMGNIQDNEVLALGMRKFAARSSRLRTSFAAVLQELARTLQGLIDTFMKQQDMLYDFWLGYQSRKPALTR